MRTIKFRAWIKGRMLSTDDLLARGFCPMSLVSVDGDKAIFMQFTGLTDKNGNEIYEGDIVQRGIITFCRGKFTGTYYDSGGIISEDWEDDLYQESGIEVRGNIYENPELLNDE